MLMGRDPERGGADVTAGAVNLQNAVAQPLLCEEALWWMTVQLPRNVAEGKSSSNSLESSIARSIAWEIPLLLRVASTSSDERMPSHNCLS